MFNFYNLSIFTISKHTRHLCFGSDSDGKSKTEQRAIYDWLVDRERDRECESTRYERRGRARKREYYICVLHDTKNHTNVGALEFVRYIILYRGLLEMLYLLRVVKIIKKYTNITTKVTKKIAKYLTSRKHFDPNVSYIQNADCNTDGFIEPRRIRFQNDSSSLKSTLYTSLYTRLNTTHTHAHRAQHLPFFHFSASFSVEQWKCK